MDSSTLDFSFKMDAGLWLEQMTTQGWLCSSQLWHSQGLWFSPGQKIGPVAHMACSGHTLSLLASKQHSVLLAVNIQTYSGPLLWKTKPFTVIFKHIVVRSISIALTFSSPSIPGRCPRSYYSLSLSSSSYVSVSLSLCLSLSLSLFPLSLQLFLPSLPHSLALSAVRFSNGERGSVLPVIPLLPVNIQQGLHGGL